MFNFFKKKKESTTKQQAFISDMTARADELVAMFNERLDNALDYSVASLQVLDDEILSLFHENLHDTNEDMLDDIITQAGSYIFEVARTNFGGAYYWYDKLSQPILVTGQPKFEISILAFEKVKQRIQNGDEDNIPFYLKGYINHVQSAKKGDKALVT